MTMWTSKGLCLLLFVFLANSGAQTETAFTLTECKTDIEVWSRELSAERHLTAESLYVRQKELIECQLDYKEAPEKSQWELHDLQLDREIERRLYDFLGRHKLIDQFNEEDAQGER